DAIEVRGRVGRSRSLGPALRAVSVEFSPQDQGQPRDLGEIFRPAGASIEAIRRRPQELPSWNVLCHPAGEAQDLECLLVDLTPGEARFLVSVPLRPDSQVRFELVSSRDAVPARGVVARSAEVPGSRLFDVTVALSSDPPDALQHYAALLSRLAETR